MAKGKPLTENQIKQIVKEYSKSKNISKVAESLSLNRSTVLKHLKHLNLFFDKDKSNKGFTDEEIKNIIYKYEQGESPTKIATELQVSSYSVSKILKEQGKLRNRTKAIFYDRLSNEETKKIIEMYGRGLSSNKIATELEISSDIVLKHLHLSNIPIKTNSSYSRCLLTELQINDICKEYENGENISKLASKYHSTNGTIKKILISHGFEITRKKSLFSNRKKLSFEEQQLVLKQYKENKEFTTIAQNFNVSEHTIRRIIKSHNIEREKSIGGLKPNQVVEICQIYQEENVSINKLAQLYTMSYTTMKKLLLSKGVLSI